MTNNTKLKVGRPEITLSSEQINSIEGLAKNLTVDQIADYLGISQSSFRRLKERNSDVLTAYKKGKSRGINEAAGILWEKMKLGDTAATIFFLKTQAGWSEKQQVDVTTRDLTNELPQFVIETSAVLTSEKIEENEISND